MRAGADVLGKLGGGDEGRARTAAAAQKLARWRVDRDAALCSVLPGRWTRG